jgi:1-acyl-sn-glycerol-3-phosphate acyltransferase
LRLLGYGRSLLLALIWCLLALPAAILVFPWTLVSRDVRLLFRTGFWITRTGLPLVGVRVVERGRANLPFGACILMANHASNLDPPAFIPVLPQPLALYLKASLMRIPVLGYAMRLGGFIPVERDGTREAAAQAASAAMASLARGRRLVIFPEGTRSRDGDLLPFKKGPFILAMQAGVPVVPVTIAGAHALLPKGSLSLQAGTVTVIFHPPLDPSDYEDREELALAVRRTIADGFAQST